MNDYEVLGLKDGADEKEIKRAYFKLVRQFSPEKEPEKFQQIRRAYENLKNGGEQKKLILKIPEDRLAQKFFQQVESLYKQHDYSLAMETAEEAIRYYGEWDGFLYYLAMAQLGNGNTGKAVKSFEKLVEQNPGHVIFAKNLAQAYLERGYGKKAYLAFEKAYEMGCREIEFLNDYALNCRDRGDYSRGIRLLTELIEHGRADPKKNMSYQLNAFAGMFYMNMLSGGKRLREIKERFFRFLEEMSPYLTGYEDLLEDVLPSVIYVLKKDAVFYEEDRRDICESLRKGLGSKKMERLWKHAESSADHELISDDDRLSEPWKVWNGLLAAKEMEGTEEWIDPETQRFILLDCRLCILEGWPGIRKEAEIIRREYPDFYEAVREYIETLENTRDMEYLRRKIKKDYDRLGRYMPTGLYDEMYGGKWEASEPGPVWEDHDDIQKPYVRIEPKIGRNDPCPCGSGKKYKKCCGR